MRFDVMACKFINKCPSATGWCKIKETITEECADFIFSAFENQKNKWISAEKEREENIGETSDGYHTFNELYHHRAILFSVICNSNEQLAWKSKKHDDGTMYENMFIVGINTPQGQATYHYDVEPYWDMFNVKEIDNAPVWDGHTPTQACERILSINENKLKEV